MNSEVPPPETKNNQPKGPLSKLFSLLFSGRAKTERVTTSETAQADRAAFYALVE